MEHSYDDDEYVEFDDLLSKYKSDMTRGSQNITDFGLSSTTYAMYLGNIKQTALNFT
jgi:hypothetical protein